MALVVEWLGCVPYADALARQEAALAACRGGGGDRLLLLEHPPVVTLGRSARPEHLLSPPETLAELGVELHETARGGDVTYHGRGQLVGYLVVDLAATGAPDVHAHLRAIEAALGAAVADLGIEAERRVGMTGLFVAGSEPPRKLASIGVGVRGWVTWHGFALNVDIDLAEFAVIVPCGLHGVEMTSLSRELGGGAPSDLPERAREAVSRRFAQRW